jgi:serine/threonine-protein kinase SRK2
MAEIKTHPWFLKNRSADLMNEDKMINMLFEEPEQPMQSVNEIMQIISEATIPPVGYYDIDMMEDDLDLDLDLDDFDSDREEIDIESSGEVVYAL